MTGNEEEFCACPASVVPYTAAATTNELHDSNDGDKSIARQRVSHEPAPPFQPPIIKNTMPNPPFLNNNVPQAPQRCGLARTSLILGIASYVTCSLTMIPAIICGIIALNKIEKSNGTLGGRGQALAGIITGGTSLVVIAIVGILASAAIPTFVSARLNTQTGHARADLATIRTALDAFEVDNGFYPKRGLADLVENPQGTPNWHGPYIKALPQDPWGHPYIYECPGRHNPSAYDLMSVGPDGVAGTHDDITNWDLSNR